MPLYEYRCDTCDKVYEVMQKFSDAPLEACEECGKPVRKLMSMTSFSLKGAGWYATDYKKSSAPAPKSTASPAAATPVATTPAPVAAAATPAAKTT